MRLKNWLSLLEWVWSGMAVNLTYLTVWIRKWLSDFNGGKPQLVSFGCEDVNDCGDTSVLEEKASLKVLLLPVYSKLIWCSNAISISKEIGGLIRFKKFPLLLRFISISLPCGLARNTIAISGLVPLIATWICLVTQVDCWSYTCCFS